MAGFLSETGEDVGDAFQKIVVASGTGEGPTPVAAFDAALNMAGVSNYNLIALSSVIPPGSRLERGRFVSPAAEYGHCCYVVIARHDENQPGKSAWAGLGWIQDETTGRGLFVELHGDSRTGVERAIHESLDAMRVIRAISYGPIQAEIVGIPCRDKPVCAVVVAVYRSEGWTA